MGGATLLSCLPLRCRLISIHAPRGGSDGCALRPNRHGRGFQSTLPVGGATFPSTPIHTNSRISIHAPRGGSDMFTVDRFLGLRDFNPRSPWGERRCLYTGISPRLAFQSTLPVGGATNNTKAVSTHCKFQSTLPVGGATMYREEFGNG